MTMQSLRFVNLPNELSFGLAEIQQELAYAISDYGEVSVVAEKGDCLSIRKADSGITITYSRRCEFFRALSLLNGVLNSGEDLCEVGKYRTLCYMADVSRNAVLSLPAAKRLMRYLALMGYTSMMLYTEDTYELEGHPYFGHMRGRYTEAELRELDDYADALGIELIPCIQTLAHLETALKWPEFATYRDTPDILLAGDERTYALVEQMIEHFSRCFRTRRIHIGMDEAEEIGRGGYLNAHGYRPASDIMMEHIGKVMELCRKYGLEPMMWSDMFFFMTNGKYHMTDPVMPQDVIDRFPKGMGLVFWDYFHVDQRMLTNMHECHKLFDTDLWFAGGAFKWMGFAPHNAFSIEVAEQQLAAVEACGVDQIIATGWGDDGAEASQFSNLATLLYYAERSYRDDPSTVWLNTRAEQCFDIPFEGLLAFDIPNQLPNGPTKGRKLVNPAKYLLYNDPLERLMDCQFDPETANAGFRENAEKLMKWADHPRFGYAISTLASLCRVLGIKADMGNRLYHAYQSRDTETLRQIANVDIPATLAELDTLIALFRTQWLRENKSFGWIVHDIRLGGLSQRLRSTQLLLNDYLDGKAEKIEELEYAPLPLRKSKYDDPDSPYFATSNWRTMVAAGVM